MGDAAAVEGDSRSGQAQSDNSLSHLEPQTYERQSLQLSQARSLLGLPERSPLLPAQVNTEDKQRRIDEFIAKRLSELPEDRCGLITRNKRQMTEESQRSRKGFLNALERKKAVFNMRRKGLQNAEAVVTAIESEMNLYGLKGLDSDAAVNNLSNFTPEDLQKALHRLRILGGRCYSSDFDHPDMLRLLQGVNVLTEEEFQKICGDLDPYSILEKPISLFYQGDKKYETEATNHRSALMQVVKNKGLSAEEKHRLDQLQRLALLDRYHYSPTVSEDETIKYEGITQLQTALKCNLPDNAILQITEITQDCVYRNLKDSEAGITIESIPIDQCHHIPFLYKNARLSQVAALVQKGFDIRNLVFGQPTEVSETIDGQYRYIDNQTLLTDIDHYVEFTSNQEQLEWAATFAELLGEKNINLPRYGQYRELYKHKEELVDIAQVVRSLPQEVGASFGQLIGFDKSSLSYQFDGKAVIGNLYSLLEKSESQAMSADDREYVFRLSSLCRTLKFPYFKPPEGIEGHFLQLLSFIAQRKENLDTYLIRAELSGSVGMTGTLAKELLSGNISSTKEELVWYSRYWPGYIVEEFDPETILQYVFDIEQFADRFFEIPAGTIEAADCFDAQENEILLHLYSNRDYHVFEETIFSNRERLKTFFRDGKPTVVLFELEAGSKRENYLNGFFPHLSKLLTAELIASFPAQEQPFWRFFQRFPNKITYDQKANIVDGHPTVPFFEQAYATGSDQIISAVQPLLVEEADSFPTDQKPFWRFISQCPHDMVEFSYQKRDLIVNGIPTVDYFSQAARLRKGGFKAMLTPDAIGSFPAQEQPFWKFISRFPHDLIQFSINNRALFDPTTGLPTIACFEQAARAKDTSCHAFLTSEVIASFPKEQEAVWNAISRYPTSFDFFVLNRDSLNQETGALTVATFEKAAQNTRGEFQTYLTGGAIASLLEDQKVIWTAVSQFPRQSYNFAVLNRDLIDPVTGIPTAAFFDKALEPINGIPQYEAVLPLLKPEIISTFPLDKRNFWQSFAAFPKQFRDRILSYGPELIQTDSDCGYFAHLFGNDFAGLDKAADFVVGERLFKLQQKGRIGRDNLVAGIIAEQFYGLKAKYLEPATQAGGIPQQEGQAGVFQKIDGSNWHTTLHAFIGMQDLDNGLLPRFPEEAQKQINELFKSAESKDFCLQQLHALWDSYLEQDRLEATPLTLVLTSELISQCEGTGPLSQIEAFSLFIESARNSFLRSSTSEVTKTEIFQGIKTIEERFKAENWSNDDRSDFYTISRDVLNAAPSLYTDFLTIFQKLKPKQMKQFARDLYPLYRAQLTLAEQGKRYEGQVTHSIPELTKLRHDLRAFSEGIGVRDDIFTAERNNRLNHLKELFKNRFGIVKIPDNFTPEHIRSISNTCLYLANLNDRDSSKETTLGFYLALMINDQWEVYRMGQDIDPDLYLESTRVSHMKPLLEKRKVLNPLTSDHLGIAAEEIPEFQRIFQREVQNVMVGNVETIDVKLHAVQQNLESLIDPDLYPEALDKERLQLLLEFGNKKIGGVAAKMFQELGGKPMSYSPEETVIKDRVLAIIKDHQLGETKETVKKHFQDDIKPISAVVNIWQYVKDVQVETEITTLRSLVEPNPEIIAIFNRLGEDFKPTSGALALSQDLTYLDNLVVKRESELTADEKLLLQQYLAGIRTQMVKMEIILGDIRKKFESVKQANISNQLLKDRIGEIGRIIYLEGAQQAITSTLTSNMNSVIENIRACLSCRSSGCNNDTNLTFGDPNKFFLFTQSEIQQQGSTADQIVFALPITHPDGKKEIGLVMDRIYGASTPDVLTNHVSTLLKTYRALKLRFPEIKLSIIVSGSALGSGGMNLSMLQERLLKETKELVITEEKDITATMVASAAGAHYIEFSSVTGGRVTGDVSLNGVVIRQ